MCEGQKVDMRRSDIRYDFAAGARYAVRQLRLVMVIAHLD
jgi:hypothetical protein